MNKTKHTYDIIVHVYHSKPRIAMAQRLVIEYETANTFPGPKHKWFSPSRSIVLFALFTGRGLGRCDGPHAFPVRRPLRT